MDFPHQIPGVPPSSSFQSQSQSQTRTNGKQYDNSAGQAIATTTTNDEPTNSRCDYISVARSRIHLLSAILTGDESDTGDPDSISFLADSDRPARSLLSSGTAYSAVSSSLTTSSPSATGDSPICHWLYDTFLSDDSDLRLVVISFIPLLAGIYFSRIHSLSSPPPSVAGLEAVLIAVYSSETNSRAGKPILISIPDLSQPSLYHYPRVINNIQNPSSAQYQPTITVVSPPLEPETTIKSTKRATIVGVALDCYYKQISQMSSCSKFDFCKFAADWAGQDCPCKFQFDQKPQTAMITDRIATDELEINENLSDQMKNLQIVDGNSNNVATGTRIPLPWELFQPVLRILGHCLLSPLNPNHVKDAASIAIQCLYARSIHDLNPQAILASRSLVQLDKRSRESASSMIKPVSSNDTTPTESKKPETLLLTE
ncbi:hypothetical protein LXL04_017074 [Taraxacum kok-saghyz]